ncbi:ABC-2 transporter permease [Paraclostridium tenue]|uniref:ABC transporter permease n=1 Tax=Paraclostridium tenue TaxID=1737 RepID=A0ABN1M4G8_9FIRM
MLNLIKKDFIVSIKGEGIRNIKYVLVFLFMYFFFNSSSYYITPIFISYLIVANTFYNDYKSNNMNYINSIPLSKEDIVYSKYILAFIVIILVTTICSLINFILEPIFHRSSVLNDIYFSLSIFILIVSIVLPMYFKFGYHNIRTIAGILSVFIFFIAFIPMDIIATMIHHSSISNELSCISFTGTFSNLLNFLVNQFRVMNISMPIIVITIFIIFILSMYISLKIINKKNNNIKTNKFIKLSLFMIIISALFILGNKFIFKNLIHEDDYLIKNNFEIDIKLNKKYQTKNGLKLRFKIENPTKYTFRLEESYITFDMYKDKNKEMLTNSPLKIDMKYPFEESDINWPLFSKGIKPHSYTYMEYTIPKGLNLDDDYFSLDSIAYDITGKFLVDLPFTHIGDIIIRPDFNMGGSMSEVSLPELKNNK